MCALLAVQWDLLVGPDYIWDLIDGMSVRGGEVTSRWFRGCLYKSWMGVVRSSGKSSLGDTYKDSIFVPSRVIRTESRVVEDMLQTWDLDSVGIRDKDTVREAFEKNLSFEDGKHFAPLTLEGATSAVTR